jgi:histone H1/5
MRWLVTLLVAFGLSTAAEAAPKQKPAATKTTKKPAAKKASVKKPVAKKPVAKKPVAKQSPAKKKPKSVAKRPMP